VELRKYSAVDPERDFANTSYRIAKGSFALRVTPLYPLTRAREGGAAASADRGAPAASRLRSTSPLSPVPFYDEQFGVQKRTMERGDWRERRRRWRGRGGPAGAWFSWIRSSAAISRIIKGS